ncbi:Hypothetical predicted protein, partial [Pelobates cultripes]
PFVPQPSQGFPVSISVGACVPFSSGRRRWVTAGPVAMNQARGRRMGCAGKIYTGRYVGGCSFCQKDSKRPSSRRSILGPSFMLVKAHSASAILDAAGAPLRQHHRSPTEVSSPQVGDQDLPTLVHGGIAGLRFH